MSINMKWVAYFALCQVFHIALLNAAEDKSTKCSKALNKIPVEKNFDIDKFAGEWFTATRTTWAFGANTYGSMTIEIFKQADGIWKFRFSGSRDNKCLPVSESTLKALDRPGHFLIKSGNTVQATFIVSMTDYKDVAMVIFCYKHPRGKQMQCENDGHQIDIMARSGKTNKKSIANYIKRATMRLCGKQEDFIDTKPGVCKIPNILEQAKLDKEKLDKAVPRTSSSDSVECAVKNVPVQSNVDLTQMEGLWYEIARTRFTFNKMESVVSFHRLDEDMQTIKSYYTGTLFNSNTEGEVSNPVCMTAIKGMSQPREGATDPADRVGRIGWEESSYPWSPTKVIYSDGEYTMFYACYSGEFNQPCTKEAMEVTLVGKSREISHDKKNEIYSKLPSICVSPSDMKDTEFLANCTSWVDIEEEDTRDRCRLDNINVYAEYDFDQMIGRWFLYGSINYNNKTSLQGVIMDRHAEGMNEVIHSTITAFAVEDKRQCVTYSSRARDTCIDTAEFVTTMPVGGRKGFVFTKVLYIDDYTLVEYVCNHRGHDGHCKKEGVNFNVYTKSDTTNSEMVVGEALTTRINGLAESVCLDPEDLHVEYEWCDAPDTEHEQPVNNDPQCDVDQLSIVSDIDDYKPELIFGYWHEHARITGSSLFTDVTSTVAYITSTTNDTLQIYTTGFPADKGQNDDNSKDDKKSQDEKDAEDIACAEVTQKSLISRCRSVSSGDYLARFEETEDYATYIPFKILYSDYSKVLVTYGCENIQPGGLCAPGAANVRIWSRNMTLDDEARDFAYEMLFWACQDPYVNGGLTVFNHEETGSCMSDLEAYVTEHELEYVAPEDEVRDSNQQQDGAEKKLDAIDLAFSMSDDEFYADDTQQTATTTPI